MCTNCYPRKGIADEELEKKEFERGRKRNRQNDDLDGSDERKRVRSESSYSSISVTTISTKPSPSSPFHGESSKHRNYNLPKSQISNIERKRRRSSISSEGSYMSDPNHTKDVHLGGTNDRSTRRRFNDASPMARGRKKSRTPPHGQRPSLSRDKGSPIVDGRSIRARSQSSSSHERGNLSITETTGANRLPDRGPNERQDQFSSRSGRNSTRRVRDRSFSSNSLSRRQYSIVDERYGVSSRDNGHYARPEIENRELRHRQLPRVRSLSPFSKRLALTQKMSTGE